MTTKTVKAQNWSDETVAKLTSAYAENQNLTELSVQFGKTVPALRSKLVSLGIYKAQEKRAVGGASSVRKIQLVKQVAQLADVDFAEIESLEKANKEALETLINVLQGIQAKQSNQETE